MSAKILYSGPCYKHTWWSLRINSVQQQQQQKTVFQKYNPPAQSCSELVLHAPREKVRKAGD